MAKHSRSSMFREYKIKDPNRTNNAYLKYIRLVYRDMSSNYDINESQMNFMIFVYDYEFFTLDHISGKYFYSKAKLGSRLVYPLVNSGYMYKYHDKLSPNTHEEAMFRETKYSYRVRYALTQKSRLLVQKFYRKLNGEEQINVPS